MYKHTQTHAETHRHTQAHTDTTDALHTHTDSLRDCAHRRAHVDTCRVVRLSNPLINPPTLFFACANAGRAHWHTNLCPVIFVVLSAARRRRTHEHDQHVTGRPAAHFFFLENKKQNGGHPALPAHEAESGGLSQQMPRVQRTYALHGWSFAQGCARAVAAPTP